jgi:hypothetical protein
MLRLGRLLSLLAALGISGCLAGRSGIVTDAAGTLSTSLVCEPLSTSGLVREDVIYQAKGPAALRLDLLFSADRKSAYISGFRSDCYLFVQSTEGPLKQVRQEPLSRRLFPDGPPQDLTLPDAKKYSAEQFQKCETDTDGFLNERLGRREDNESAYDSVFGSVDEPACFRLIVMRSPTILLEAGANNVLVEFADAKPFVGFF